MTARTADRFISLLSSERATPGRIAIRVFDAVYAAAQLPIRPDGGACRSREGTSAPFDPARSTKFRRHTRPVWEVRS